MVILTNFNSVAITYLSSFFQKFHFPVEHALNSVQT